MSRNSTKKKKSTSKYRKFKISPLISIVAIIEVLVLVAISTYAWFIVAQEKLIDTGSVIGYGCTYQTTHPTRIVVIPVGYYDGYDRALSNLAYVLIHGKRAPIRGRICMNMCMADVTDIPDVKMGDEVVLLGRQGNEVITAEQLASWSGTINYELTTQIQTSVPRIAV